MSADLIVGGTVGESKSTAGTHPPIRQGILAEQIVNDVGLGKYFESVRLNRIFTTMVKTVTIAATHNTPIAAATATPVVGIHNPLGNTKAAVILRVALTTTSGTPAGGQAVLNSIQTTTAPTTPAGSTFCNLLSASASPQGSTMRTFNNTALTGMLPVVGSEVMVVGGATAAAAAGNGGVNAPTAEDMCGIIIVPPTFLLALMAGTGAGTSWVVNASLTWAEVDWPL